MISEKVAEFKKSISLTLTREAVKDNYAEIHDQIKLVLLRIETESELVQKDNLARGELIDSVRLWSSVETSEDGQHRRWSTDIEKLKCEFSENDPPEYWGDISLTTSDFIAALPKYPWMPSDISEDEIPF